MTKEEIERIAELRVLLNIPDDRCFPWNVSGQEQRAYFEEYHALILKRSREAVKV